MNPCRLSCPLHTPSTLLTTSPKKKSTLISLSDSGKGLKGALSCAKTRSIKMSDEKIKKFYIFFLARQCFDSPLSRHHALILTKAEGRREFAGRNSSDLKFSHKVGLSSPERPAARAKNQRIFIIWQVSDCHATLWKVLQSGQRGMIFFFFHAVGSNHVRSKTCPMTFTAVLSLKSKQGVDSLRFFLFVIAELF